MTPRTAIISDILALTSISSSIATWQEQLDWTLRMILAVVGIIAGSIAIYQRLKKRGT